MITLSQGRQKGTVAAPKKKHWFKSFKITIDYLSSSLIKVNRII